MKFESDASWSLATGGVRASQQITPLESGLCYSVAESRCLLRPIGTVWRLLQCFVEWLMGFGCSWEDGVES